jgi:SAM-dependent methyltransferase
MFSKVQKKNAFRMSSLETISALCDAHSKSYFCSICGKISEKFREAGVGKKRKNARCPDCGSLERHRLFWIYFMNFVWPRLRKGKKNFLHVAPEPFFTNLLREHEEINYISGDLMMPEAMVKLDLTDIQFWDNQFDAIICSHILEHIVDDRLAMREMYRVLKPGGFLLLMVPIYGDHTYEDCRITSPEDRRKHFGQKDHVRKYGKDIFERLEKSGFKVSEWPSKGELSSDIVGFIACGNRQIYECEKNHSLDRK